LLRVAALIVKAPLRPREETSLLVGGPHVQDLNQKVEALILRLEEVCSVEGLLNVLPVALLGINEPSQLMIPVSSHEKFLKGFVSEENARAALRQSA
jgi:hypothetical protein